MTLKLNKPSHQKGKSGKKGESPQKFNALKYGILSPEIVLPFESESEYEKLQDALFAELQPQGQIEIFLVQELAQTIFRKQRIRVKEKALYRSHFSRILSNPDEPYLRHDLKIDSLAAVGCPCLERLFVTSASDRKSILETLINDNQNMENFLGISSSSVHGLNVFEGDVDFANAPNGFVQYLNYEISKITDYYSGIPISNVTSAKNYLETLQNAIRVVEEVDEIFDYVCGQAMFSDETDLLRRYETNFDRRIERTLATLLTLQKTKVQQY